MKRTALWLKRNGFTNGLWRLSERDAAAQANLKRKTSIVATEPGADGKPQTIIPGCEPTPTAKRSALQRRADAPLKPTKPQHAADCGLFSDDAKQRDLF